MKSKNLGNKLMVSIGGAILIGCMMYFIVTSIVQRQLFQFGANTQIKNDSRCESYKKQYVELMLKKENMNDLLYISKQDKCLK